MDDQEISQRARPRTRRRAVCATAALAIVVAVAGWAFAAGDEDSARVLVTATTNPAASTSADESATTTVSVTTTSDGSEPTTTASATGETFPTDSGAEPTTSTTPPESSPWPPGTVVGWLGTLGLTGTVSFTPSVAPKGTTLSYTATLTNPTDHWVFGAVYYPGLALFLHTPDTDGMIPVITRGVPETAPEFQHQTPRGLEVGLLLAPHASYSFSNDCGNGVEYYANADYIVQADIIYAPVGVANGAAGIVRGAGSFTVTFPPTGSTTTAHA